jgi:hypothetical protein
MGDNTRLLIHRLLRGPKLVAGSPKTIKDTDSKGHPCRLYLRIPDFGKIIA